MNICYSILISNVYEENQRLGNKYNLSLCDRLLHYLQSILYIKIVRRCITVGSQQFSDSIVTNSVQDQ